MILSAHQPHYMPWLGYLDKIARSDVFVLMDDLQYEAQNYQNRQRLKLKDGANWLIVPLLKSPQKDPIINKKIFNSPAKDNWQRVHWATIESNYRKTPHFEELESQVRDIYSNPWESLVDLNIAMLNIAMKNFDINVPIIRSSTLDLSGQKTQRIADMCLKLGAQTYLSGKGGSTSYLDLDLLRDNAIDVSWQEFDHPTYNQLHPHLGFVKNLGFLDYLFNEGKERAQGLLKLKNEEVKAYA